MTVNAPLAMMIFRFVNDATPARRGAFDVAQAVSLRLQTNSLHYKEVIMKFLTIFAAFIFSILLLSAGLNMTRNVSAQGKKPPEVIVLGKEAKLGQVTFNHLKHITEN